MACVKPHTEMRGSTKGNEIKEYAENHTPNAPQWNKLLMKIRENCQMPGGNGCKYYKRGVC